MNQDFYTYIQQMYGVIQAQEKRIQDLEKLVNGLKNELQHLQTRTPIHVDTIEYKFDQLKVETLEGTLNIGLNPSDLENIEDFEVANKKISANLSPKEQMRYSMEIEKEIDHYLQTDLERLVSTYADDLKLEMDESYCEFIRNDLKQQIPHRINYYLKQLVKQKHSQEREDAKGKIVQQVKKDIDQAVFSFLKNLPPQSERKDEEL